MEGYIELNYKDITNIILKTGMFSVEQSGANVILAHDAASFAAEFVLHGVVSESERVCVEKIEGDENAPAVRCLVFDGNDQVCDTESMYPDHISGKLKLFNYGPVEIQSATAEDVIGLCISGICEKYSSLGGAFLNDAEKEVAAVIDYVSLVLYPESARSVFREHLQKAVKQVKAGSPFAEAIDRLMKENMGIPGRRNFKRFVKEAKRHYAKEFDRDKYFALCKEAVKNLPFKFENEVLRKYESLKERISYLMKNAGYSGEYPCFEKGDKYVKFGASAMENGGYLQSRFGVKGNEPKKYENKVNGSDSCTVAFSDVESSEGLSVYTDGIFAILEGGSPSLEFENLICSGDVRNSAGRFFGVICIMLALCLGAVVAMGEASNFIQGFAAAALLIGFGCYVLFSKRKIHALKADKGAEI